MSPIKALLFDKDGTLFDFAATWNVWAVGLLERLCGSDHAKMNAVSRSIGFDLHAQSFNKHSLVIAGTAQEVAAALAPHFPERNPADLLRTLNAEATAAPQVEAVPLVPLLRDLRAQGLALGVATNDAQAPARAHLEAAGVAGFFDFIAGSDSGYGGKPEPGQLLAFGKAVNVAPKHIAMIGDSTHDLLAGRAAGMTCVAVLSGLAEADALEPFADVVLPDIGHLPAWLAAGAQTKG